MGLDVRGYYDGYWQTRDRPRCEARSRERARLTLRLLGDASGGRRLLDLGCGPGHSLEVFRAAGFQVAGVDASPVAVREAEALGCRVRQFDLEEEPLQRLRDLMDGPPEVVVALEVLEHLGDPLGFLERLRAFSSGGTRVVISLPNEIHLLARLQIACGRLPFGGHADPHLRHFDRRAAALLFREAGYRVVTEERVSLIPPRWPLVGWLATPAVRLFPGSFCLATVYLLEGVAHERT